MNHGETSLLTPTFSRSPIYTYVPTAALRAVPAQHATQQWRVHSLGHRRQCPHRLERLEPPSVPANSAPAKGLPVSCH
jgi:hypothetical protein